ncbi:hypothetical protein [Legionella maceachernii]|uniref:Uncharacterized protein n=1 Tax=Legionella maceachernii TaxID=466 RepID=A0A0W0W8J2_9GAMM|nr:hypothetical protein [Legionella maceachernii]KTD28693.1 hypothetical protein Lmac_0979 [Legionella maceachernii]SKA22069.1 hypothetical protein SAMN02745128_02633 [Legionella maceachernii]SUP01404.1 Uncharacterised protein [Legionella maceachernii]
MSSSDKSNSKKIKPNHEGASRAVRIEVCYKIAERESFFDEKAIKDSDHIRIQLPEGFLLV